MLLRLAVVLLVVWLLGVSGVYDVGVSVHILLLAGLLLFLLGVLKARDASAAQARTQQPLAVDRKRDRQTQHERDTV